MPGLIFSGVMGSHSRPETETKMCGYAREVVIFITQDRVMEDSNERSIVLLEFGKSFRQAMPVGFSRYHAGAESGWPKSAPGSVPAVRLLENTPVCDFRHCLLGAAAAESTSSLSLQRTLEVLA